MLTHRLGDAFAASDAGGDELEGVAPVDLRARRAARGATVAAWDQQHAPWLACSDYAREELARFGVDALVPAAEANRV
jgi:hypothetical protein